jgi:hypothetical protein
MGTHKLFYCCITLVSIICVYFCCLKCCVDGMRSIPVDRLSRFVLPRQCRVQCGCESSRARMHQC